MKKDINIIPILTKYDEKTLNELNPDADYPTESFEQDDLIKLAFGIALNGKPVEDYNVYIIINAYDNDNGRYDIFSGGFKVVKDKFYDKVIFKRTFIKSLDEMKRELDLTVYKLYTELDHNNPNLREGDFEKLSNITPDLELILSEGIFISATTFNIE